LGNQSRSTFDDKGITDPDTITRTDISTLSEVGIFPEGEERSGTYLLRDDKPVCALTNTDGLELLPVATALKEYQWLREKYYWKAVSPGRDKITRRCAAQGEPLGFFIRVKKGARITLPCQTGLLIISEGIDQAVHNIVILEEDSELYLVTGCTTGHGVNTANHFAISEQYVGRNASLTNTMVHSWGKEVNVFPRSGTVVEEGGKFISNYVSLRSAGDVQSVPKTWLNGEGASAKYTTVVMGTKGSRIETGGEVYLNARDTSAELAHRAVCAGGRMYQKGLLIGNASCRAHVDCAGLLLDPGKEGLILSVPGLKALHPQAQMSHEASVGRISPEQIEYLQARGLEEREAISMIVRGFLDLDIEGVSPELDAGIAEIVELAGHGEGG
jgi:Fe-S cluster assembly scaffold protein SufB